MTVPCSLLLGPHLYSCLVVDGLVSRAGWVIRVSLDGHLLAYHILQPRAQQQGCHSNWPDSLQQEWGPLRCLLSLPANRRKLHS